MQTYVRETNCINPYNNAEIDKFEKEGTDNVDTTIMYGTLYDELLIVNPGIEYDIVEIDGWYSYDCSDKLYTTKEGWITEVRDLGGKRLIGPFIFASREECASTQRKRLDSFVTIVYTDGSCLNKTNNNGGWAWAVETSKDESTRYKSGFVSNTTNQRMELQAALEAVTTLNGKLTIYTDSAYIVNCFKDKWWSKWRRNGWRTANGAVMNKDLWEPLIRICIDDRPGEITWIHVKAHNGTPLNEFVDKLANRASSTLTGVSVDA